MVSYERDPRDYYNDLPGKIPPIPPTDEKSSVVSFESKFLIKVLIQSEVSETKFQLRQGDLSRVCALGGMVLIDSICR